MNPNEHKKKTVTGLKWNIISQIVTQGATFAIGVLLMRLLNPSDFGVIAMITVFIALANIFKDFGLTKSLIQKKEIGDLDKNTVFYTNLLVGIILTSILVFSSKYIAYFYDTPKLSKITKVIATLFFIQSFGMVHHALMIKELNFKKVFIVRIITVIVGGSFAVFFAFSGYGVWTLVYQQIISAVVNVIVVWVMIKWRPKYTFSYVNLKSHLRFGLPLLGNNILTYWSRNADNLFIGKFLNSGALGLYSRGYNLMMMPINQVTKVISNVMLPSFSLIQGDTYRIQSIYLKMARIIAFVTFPMMGILFVTSKPMVFFVFGEKWEAIIPLLKIFSIIGAFQSLGALNGVIYVSTGMTARQFWINIFVSIVNTIAFIIGVQFNIYAVVIAYLIANLISIIPSYYYLGKIINLTLITIFLNISSHLLIVLILIVAGHYTGNLIQNYSDLFQIVVLTLEFTFGWLVLMLLINPKIISEIKILARDFRN